jgi:hypothetical protein
VKLFLFISLFFLFCTGSIYTQNKAKADNYFGFQYRPLIPVGIVGDRPFSMQEESFRTTVTPVFGYNYGGLVRVGITEQMSIETGLSYTKRNFRLDYEIIDSNVVAENRIGFVNYDIPVNWLVYIRLGRDLYANASLGLSLNFYPSNVRTTKSPFGQHLFIFEGRRGGFFSLDINSNVGFEYRTKEKGIFYAGFSGKLPIQPILIIASEYRYDTFSQVTFEKIEGATVSLDFKYFFHRPSNRGVQFKGGPIEQ